LPDAREIRLSDHPENTAAARLYAEAGFRPHGDREDSEIVAVYGIASTTRD